MLLFILIVTFKYMDGFSFFRLLVIIMFLVCSGGGWWYRYWLQGRYRAGATTLPHRSYNARVQHSARGSACQAQQARISYNTARNTVLLHRMWKGASYQNQTILNHRTFIITLLKFNLKYPVWV